MHFLNMSARLGVLDASIMLKLNAKRMNLQLKLHTVITDVVRYGSFPKVGVSALLD